jgi:hypothetical protein
MMTVNFIGWILPCASSGHNLPFAGREGDIYNPD